MSDGQDRKGAGLAARIALVVFASVACLGAAECGLRLSGGFEDVRSLVAAAAPAPTAAASTPAARGRLHPLRGWSLAPGAANPGWKHYLSLAGARRSLLEHPERHTINVFGARSGLGDYRDLEAADFTVAIFGGSVAETVAMLGASELEAALVKHRPDLAGTVRIVNFGIGGYKQPQQLALLSEMIVLGVPLDVVVNIDGYNEVVFGADNASRGHHPLFPSLAHTQTLLELGLDAPSEKFVERSAETLALRRSAEASLAWVRESAWASRLELARALAGTWAQRRLARANRLEAQLQGERGSFEDGSLLARLPDPCLEGSVDCFDRIADIWERSSVAMARLAESTGARYLHVLQPNQYVEGSKVLSAAERHSAWKPDSPWAQAVRAGYPRLQGRSQRLRESRIAFHDLTDAFRIRLETIYVDDCCHFNLRGVELVARKLAGWIADGS